MVSGQLLPGRYSSLGIQEGMQFCDFGQQQQQHSWQYPCSGIPHLLHIFRGERELFVCAKMFSHYLVKRVSSAPIGTIFKCACNLTPLDFWFSVTSAKSKKKVTGRWKWGPQDCKEAAQKQRGATSLRCQMLEVRHRFLVCSGLYTDGVCVVEIRGRGKGWFY